MRTDRNETDELSGTGPMNLVETRDGRSRSKKRKGDIELLDDGQDDLDSEYSN